MRTLQERREAAAGPLVDVLAKRSSLLEQLAALDEPYGKAYADAEAAGWTQEELTKLGAEEPAKRPRGRSKRSRSSARKGNGQSSGTAAEAPSSTGTIPAQEGAATASTSAGSTASS
ncbi:hypothetical protein [Streptomyces sp. AC602_WCS936]|uniref:hypothetical protein n=1 Tax=Streptomyces sp. AC602_WCS936 TaxID=2823685 RepID=UPI001C257D96|nr:hypothetical protein [Streptomyces sp. AC602_WCS936]